MVDGLSTLGATRCIPSNGMKPGKSETDPLEAERCDLALRLGGVPAPRAESNPIVALTVPNPVAQKEILDDFRVDDLRVIPRYCLANRIEATTAYCQSSIATSASRKQEAPPMQGRVDRSMR
jgi:hypothetical protein